MASAAPAAEWDELTSGQRELFRQAVEEGGTATPTQPVTADGRQMYLDLRNDANPLIRQLYFRMRQKAGVLPRPRTIGWIELMGSQYNLTMLIGSGARQKWVRWAVDPAPSSGPPFDPYGLQGVDHCGYLNQISGFMHEGQWETSYHSGEAVENCPDRTVTAMSYYWPNGGRAPEGAGPNPPEDGWVLTKASNRSDYAGLRFEDGCLTNWSEPAGYVPVRGGTNSACFGPADPLCGTAHHCYAHKEGAYFAYFREFFGVHLAEGEGNTVAPGDQSLSLGNEPWPGPDRPAIDREMRRPENQPLVDWLHARFLDDRLEAYVPQLRYEEQEGYLADSAGVATDNFVDGEYTNRLIDWGFDPHLVLAAADPADPADHLSLRFLGTTYLNGQPAVYHPGPSPAGHVLDFANSHEDDVQRMHPQDKYYNRVYGRVYPGPDGEAWLQYWLFYYFNEGEEWFPPDQGDHEADWEMIQIKLDSSGSPVLATYAQHGDGNQQTCPWGRVPKYTLEGGTHPIVYVDLGTHASTFKPKAEHANGIRLTPRVSQISDSNPSWPLWPGFWGASESGIRSPGYNGSNRVRWVDPPAFDADTGTCPSEATGEINPARRPRPLRAEPTLRRPRIRARRAGKLRVRIRYAVSGISARGARRAQIHLSVHPRGRRALPTSTRLPLRRSSGSAVLQLPRGRGPYVVMASVRTRGYPHSRVVRVRLR